MNTEMAQADDNFAWNIIYDPKTAYYSLRNVGTGRLMTCTSQQFRTSPRATPSATERVQLLASRSIYNKKGTALKTSSYWITINKTALTAKSETSVAGASFDANDGNTKQHWLILTEKELEVFDDFWTMIDNPLSTTVNEVEEVWYDLDGRRLGSKPTKRGIYMKNGKKVLF